MAEEIVLVIAKDQNNQEEDYFKQVYIRQLIEKKNTSPCYFLLLQDAVSIILNRTITVTVIFNLR